MNAPQTFELTMSRFIRAPRERVYDAFVDAALLRQWHCPRGMTVEEATADARVGGQWQLAMRARDGSRFIVGGEFRHLQRPERLAYTWQWDGNSPMPHVQTLIEVDFVERDGGTELSMRHSGFPAAAARDSHQTGWRSTFNRLSDLLSPDGSAASLTLLGSTRSTYVRTVRMAMAEKGIACSLVPCAPHSPEILAVHPFGKIPALRDGEITVWETSAILRYLEDSFDGPSLTPGTIAGRVRSEQWVSAVNAYLYDTMVRRYVIQLLFPRGEGGAPDRAVIDAALAEMPAQLAALEAAYATAGLYLSGGDKPCAADLLLAPILAYVQAMPEGAALLSDYPAVLRGHAAMCERASFAATQPQG
mgnify:CR=1 FL=1